jgi:hypothetical protein
MYAGHMARCVYAATLPFGTGTKEQKKGNHDNSSRTQQDVPAVRVQVDSAGGDASGSVPRVQVVQVGWGAEGEEVNRARQYSHADYLAYFELQKIAQRAMRDAVAAGIIWKPETCDACGGSHKVSGHHEDYMKMYRVHWLCATCHSARHMTRMPIQDFLEKRRNECRYYDRFMSWEWAWAGTTTRRRAGRWE